MSSATSGSTTIELFEKYVIPNYRRYPVTLVRGEGSWVWDDQGQKYLDLFPGWGCNLLGHCPAPVVEAVQEQVAQLIHVPNTWYMEAQGQWARLLSERSFGGQAFFCNSGAEANEAAIKLARLHGSPSRLQNHQRSKVASTVGRWVRQPRLRSQSITRDLGRWSPGFTTLRLATSTRSRN